jgi:hypothetical protein
MEWNACPNDEQVFRKGNKQKQLLIRRSFL